MLCAAQLNESVISERSIRDVLKCRVVNIKPIIPFLKSEDPDVRLAAIRIVGEKGDTNLLIETVKEEHDKRILFEAMKQLGQRGKNLTDLVGILETSDSVMKQEAIAMFRKSGNTDCLFALLFDRDPRIVAQVKEYFNE